MIHVPPPYQFPEDSHAPPNRWTDARVALATGIYVPGWTRTAEPLSGKGAWFDARVVQKTFEACLPGCRASQAAFTFEFPAPTNALTGDSLAAPIRPSADPALVGPVIVALVEKGWHVEIHHFPAGPAVDLYPPTGDACYQADAIPSSDLSHAEALPLALARAVLVAVSAGALPDIPASVKARVAGIRPISV